MGPRQRAAQLRAFDLTHERAQPFSRRPVPSEGQAQGLPPDAQRWGAHSTVVFPTPGRMQASIGRRDPVSAVWMQF